VDPKGVNAVRHDELNLVRVSHPAVCAWSPVVRVIGEHNDGAVGAWPVVSELFDAADVLDAVVRPDVLGAVAQQLERFLASHALPGSGQVLQLEGNFATSESIDEEYVQVYPLGRASLESNQLLRPGLMGLPGQGVLEIGLGAEHQLDIAAGDRPELIAVIEGHRGLVTLT
jgi:hypothetical protein